jgi:hypothetical protein
MRLQHESPKQKKEKEKEKEKEDPPEIFNLCRELGVVHSCCTRSSSSVFFTGVDFLAILLFD